MAKKNRNDQISTPYEYVEEMLDRIGYVKNLVGKTILENSCGQGNILVPIVNRYIKDAKIQGLSDEHIAERLSQDIIGFEINQGQRTKCIESLDKICSSSGIENVRWNIMNQDFLRYVLLHLLLKVDIKVVKDCFLLLSINQTPFYL